MKKKIKRVPTAKLKTSSNNPRFGYFLVILFLIIVLGLGFVVLKLNNSSFLTKNNNSTNQNKIPTTADILRKYPPSYVSVSPLPTAISCDKMNNEVNVSHDAYINNLITDTSSWTTFTLPVEKFSFKYPLDWKLKYEPKNSWGKPGEMVKITSPNGYTVSISTGYMGLGGGCPEDCKCANLDNYVLGELSFNSPERLYIVTIGYKQGSGIKDNSIGFIVRESKNCWTNICYGFGGKNTQGNMFIMGNWDDKRVLSPEEYINSLDVKTAISILKTAVY